MPTTPKNAAAKADPAYEVKKSPVHGNGVFARRHIDAGERIIEYRGERISWDDATQRAVDAGGPINHTFYFSLHDGRVIDGVANLGVRPMFEIDQPLLEVWLLDFDCDLYGQTIETELVAYLRGEMAFDGLDALKVQIGRDADAAREALVAP